MTGFADLDLAGRRALVTGASSGIGAAVAARLAAAGAAVAGLSRSGNAPDGVAGLACDLGDGAALDGVVDRVVAELGGLDIVVNNAGFGDWLPVAELDREFFDRLVDLNLWAPLRICQLAHPHLCESDAAAVVMIGSIDSERPSPGASVYGATKAGLGAAVVALAKEWMADGIRVNQIDPGLVRTPLASDAVAAVEASDVRINTVGRVGTPEEIAAMVHLVVAPAGGFVSGARFRVDGGALVMGPFDGLS